MKKRIIGLSIALLIFIIGVVWSFSVALLWPKGNQFPSRPDKEISFIKNNFSFTLVNAEKYSNDLYPWDTWKVAEFRSRLIATFLISSIVVIVTFIIKIEKNDNKNSSTDG